MIGTDVKPRPPKKTFALMREELAKAPQVHFGRKHVN
jgi:hypothetical protein